MNRLYSTETSPAFVVAGGHAYFLSDVNDPALPYRLWETGPTFLGPFEVTKDGVPAAFHPATAGSSPWSAEFNGAFIATAGDLDENKRLQNLEPHRVAEDPADLRHKAKQLHDLHPEAAPDGSEANRSSSPSGYVKAGAFLYFVTQQGELWRTDGTANGAFMLAEFAPTSLPFALTDFGGTLLFLVPLTDPVTSVPESQIWISDGSVAGTQFVAKLPGSAYPTMTVVGGRVAIVAGDALHFTDGTPAGTGPFVLPAEVGSIVNFSLRGVPAFQGKLWFSARTPDNLGAAVWATDGTTAGTQKIRALNQAALRWQVVGNRLWFTSQQNVPNPDPNAFPRFLDSMCELWRTDGTAAGTELVTWDAFERGIEQQVLGLAAVEDTLYFVKSDAVHGRELWRSDGTAAGTVLVQDIFPGPGSGLGDNALVHGLQSIRVGDRFLFAAEDETGVNPWLLGVASRQISPPKFQPLPAEVVTYLGEPFALTPTLQSGGPARWVAHNLPPGIVVNPATGELTGRSTYPGSYRVTLDAANQGATGVAQFTLKVLLPPELRFGFSEEGLTLTATGEPGQRFDLEATADYRTWTKVLTDLGVGDGVTVSFSEIAAKGLGFFRLVVR